ncbi:hypothetical protein [Streptomyces coelicoflavus]|uniref:hypothetical protein n=1 Tax=Streptomyces coelicoflavus TaxID=285562 RepID=UPI00363BC036
MRPDLPQHLHIHAGELFEPGTHRHPGRARRDERRRELPKTSHLAPPLAVTNRPPHPTTSIRRRSRIRQTNSRSNSLGVNVPEGADIRIRVFDDSRTTDLITTAWGMA